MNKSSLETRTRIIHLLCEGNSLRATARLVDVSFNTVVKLLIEVGTACQKYHNENVLNVKSKRVQCDEIWSFVGCKQKNVRENEKDRGDCWTWVGMDADTKLAISWYVGNRDADAAKVFMRDVAHRLAHRVQLTTDGLRVYLDAVEKAFGDEIDYMQLIKLYGESMSTTDKKYSPADCIGVKKGWVSGDPDPKHVSTSFIERQNLTMRMQMRRFTRLTNAFSKKIENHKHAIALYFIHYNFVRIHKTLRVTPAMEAGLTKKLWNIEDIVKLAD